MYRVKDFEAVSYYIGSRLANAKQYRYKVINKITKQVVKEGFTTKMMAQKYISGYVKELNREMEI